MTTLICDIFEEIKSLKGSNAKKALLEIHKANTDFLKSLKFALDPFIVFNTVKVPKTTCRHEEPLNEQESWQLFFKTAEDCSNRKITGNSAIDALSFCFAMVTEANEKWMRLILKKHLAIGVSTKTVNTVYPGHISTFDVALAQKFDLKRVVSDIVAVEPKLDGIRCFAIVEDNEVTLYSRAGKVIKNFNSTIGKELINLGPGCYDGEIMGKDFTALMRQAYRKEPEELKDTYFGIFDYLTLEEWKNKKGVNSCFLRYDMLTEKMLGEAPESIGMGIENKIDLKYLKIVPRHYVSRDESAIKSLHDKFVTEGYEGAMIKNPDAFYKFGRGYDVMKYKSFHDVDLPIKGILEGTGKHSNKLGSFIVEYKGTDVQVGSGLSDAIRETVWGDPDSFVGRTIEIRYQEVTPDGSLRFPTFVCFRNDR